MDDEDDDLDWDEWMAMTDDQQEAVLDRAWRAYDEWCRRTPLRVRQRRHIRDALARCVRVRGLGAPPFILKRMQISLVKARLWRQTGIYPGEA